MAPTNAKANYKTYEAQARMVRAIVAAHPDVKWNYKDMTEHALNHRFRRLKTQALVIRLGREQGLDMRRLAVEDNMPAAQDAVDRNNIAKYFGQSTADGIQFQFRTIKKDADQLRQTHSSGGDVANCLSLSSQPSCATTPSRAVVRTPASSRKRSRPADPKPSSTEASENEDYSDKDESPSKRAAARTPGQKNAKRKAAVRASATIASSALDSDPDITVIKEEVKYSSIFGDGAASSAASVGRPRSTAFAERAVDPVFSSTMRPNLYTGSFDEAIGAEFGDGEI
ncbi:hypothetical protein ED733_007856 [Metarhizium rileyi]|uniref:Uncharacterized protein n=1 Tax=Metarhizium rileyi (strain RCEF 4871) TaxID=1649241 RepID=A0A5C6GJS3_METRR|nr:hypothetical protein ED733_007856 [Metarhizium rileyi]